MSLVLVLFFFYLQFDVCTHLIFTLYLNLTSPSLLFQVGKPCTHLFIKASAPLLPSQLIIRTFYTQLR